MSLANFFCEASVKRKELSFFSISWGWGVFFANFGLEIDILLNILRITSPEIL